MLSGTTNRREEEEQEARITSQQYVLVFDEQGRAFKLIYKVEKKKSKTIHSANFPSSSFTSCFHIKFIHNYTKENWFSQPIIFSYLNSRLKVKQPGKAPRWKADII